MRLSNEKFFNQELGIEIHHRIMGGVKQFDLPIEFSKNPTLTWFQEIEVDQTYYFSFFLILFISFQGHQNFPSQLVANRSN